MTYHKTSESSILISENTDSLNSLTDTQGFLNWAYTIRKWSLLLMFAEIADYKTNLEKKSEHNEIL